MKQSFYLILNIILITLYNKDYIQLNDQTLEEEISFRVQMKPKSIENMQTLLNEISDPESKTQGSFLDKDELNKMSLLTDHEIKISHTILKLGGFSCNQRNDYFACKGTVSKANDLFKTNLKSYRHLETGERILRSKSIEISSFLQPYVDQVEGLVQLPTKKWKVKYSAEADPFDDKQCNKQGCAQCPKRLRMDMNIDDQKSTNSSNTQAFANFLGENWSEKDIATFASNQDQDMNQTVAKVVGPNDQTQPSDEASLDMQYIMSMGNQTPTWSFTKEGSQQSLNEPFVLMFSDILALDETPKILSISYADNLSDVAPSQKDKVEQQLVKMGLRGITVLVASGDGGTCGTFSCDQCEEEVLMFPTMSQQVTSVGGTNQQAVWNQQGFSSGGGVDSSITTPDWQKDALNQYNKVSGNSGNDSYKGRGQPDIAAQAQDVAVVTAGSVQYNCIAGTSAATPISAGVISLINDIRLNKGLKQVGFMNQLIYKSMKVSNAQTDVVKGNNGTCGTGGQEAVKGWDPVSGVGVLNFEVLRDLWAQESFEFTDDKLLFMKLARKYNRKYEIGTEAKHYQQFLTNKKEIDDFNRSGKSQTRTIENPLFDHSPIESKRKNYGYTYLPTNPNTKVKYHTKTGFKLSDSFSWVDKHAVSSVKDQGEGETCWSFSAAGAIEGLKAIQSSLPAASLANQQLIDCMQIPCTDSSGTMRQAFQWIQSNGIDQFKNYPYKDATCTYYDLPHKCKDKQQPIHIKGYKVVKSEDDLQEAVLINPVTVAIDAEADLNSQVDGIQESDTCSSAQDGMNHAVLVVGFGEEKGQKQWLIKNSWGTEFGNQGQFKLKRGVNMCGVANDMSQPQ